MPEFLPERILIIAIRAIGDVVLITPLLSVLKKRFHDTSIAVLVDGASAQVLENNPYLDQVFVIDRAKSQQLSWFQRWKSWIQLVTDLRRYQFDIVIDLFSGPRSAILGYVTRAKDRYCEDFRKSIRGLLYNHPIKICRDGRHLLEQKFNLIQPLIGNVDQREALLELYLTETERLHGKKILDVTENEQQKRIGLIPSAGSGWRVWPSERFAELADALCDTYGAKIILLGGEEDISICRHIEKRMHSQPLDLSGKTTLRELIAVLAELDLVISNVTGPMHLASALSKPKVLGLYGAADTIQYAPWGVNAMMLTKGSKEDAYWYQVDYQRDYEILCKIRVEDVLDVVKSVMTDWQGRH